MQLYTTTTVLHDNYNNKNKTCKSESWCTLNPL